MTKKFEANHKVGYFETDEALFLTPAAFVVQLQELAISHSSSLGYTLSYLDEKRRGWALLNWHIIIKQMPKYEEVFHVSTWTSECKRLQARRSFIMYDAFGDVGALVESKWVYMDLERRRPIPLEDDMKEKYGSNNVFVIDDEKFSLPQIVMGEKFSERIFQVTRRDTDTNGHVNNVKYLEWAMDDIPEDVYLFKKVVDIKIVYRKECHNTMKVVSHTTKREYDEITEIITYFFSKENLDILFSQIVTKWENMQ